MTREEIQSMAEKFPLRDFLVWGIPASHSETDNNSPIRPYEEDGKKIDHWFDVRNGFLRHVYHGYSATRAVTRDDLNSMLAFGYNTMVRMVTGKLPSYNENIEYGAGASVRSDDSWQEYFAPSVIDNNLSTELSTSTSPSWLKRQTSEHWSSVAEGEVDDSIAEVSWEADGNLPMTDFASQTTSAPTSFTGTWQVCSFTMKRDFYGWISPLLRAYAITQMPSLKKENGQWTESASRNYGMTWWLGDIHGNFKIVTGSSVVTIYWGKGNEPSDPAIRNSVHSTCTMPTLSPMFFRKNETYVISVELKDAFIVSPPGIPSGSRRKGAMEFHDFNNGYPAMATALRRGKTMGASSSYPWPSRKALGFVEMKCVIPPNRGY